MSRRSTSSTSLRPGFRRMPCGHSRATRASPTSRRAPDAKVVSLRVLGQNGKGTMHAVLAAFDWLLRNRAAMDIKVLNLSFGAPQRSSYHRELLAGVVESAWFAGVTVVAAAGNDGPAHGTVAMPGADPFVIPVGSFADQGTLATNDGLDSVFSSRGA